ncbi:restriction endonuclease subunit S [Sorangium sp. So ce185]|uniref:restriction endonuclease subunit S n=1 Tax=Sorangium sp. So ce185 TaxID=3133287 RepID=UPI003F642C38
MMKTATATPTTLGSVLVRIEAGRSVKTLERPAERGELGILRVSAVTWGEFDATENKAALPDYEPSGCPRPMKGDILLSRANTTDLVGAAVQVPRDFPDLLLSDKILKLVPDATKVDARYLLRVLQSPPTRRYFAARAGGTSGSMQNITQEDIRSVPLLLPPLPEQRRVAEILDKADAIRRKRKEAIALAEKLPQSVFLEMFGSPVDNRRRRHIVALRELVADADKINYGVVQPGDECPEGIPLVRVGDFADLRIRTDSMRRIDPKIDQRHARSRLIGNEVLIACVGATFGKVALAEPVLAGANIARAVARVPCGPRLNPLYLAYYLRLEYVQNYFRSEIRTVAQPTLNIAQIEETPVDVPSIQEQDRFVCIARAAEVSLLNQRKAIGASDALFDSIVRSVLCGELARGVVSKVA